MASVRERFYRHFQVVESGCWEWTGSLHKLGYGHFTPIRGKSPERAHRVSYELHKGPIPPGLVVMHRCDNRRCVNPAQPEVGTHKDNTADSFSKGRQSAGEGNGRALLTEDIVRAIRADPRSHSAVANEHGVSKATVAAIRSRRNWSHVT